MSCSWSKKLRPPRRAAPKENRHGLDDSLYPDVCFFFYGSCAKSKWGFFLLNWREEEKEEETISPTRCITSPALTADASLSLPSRRFSVTLSHLPLFISIWLFLTSPFSFGCIHFTVICLSLKPSSLFAPASLPAFSFYLCNNNRGVKWGTGSLGSRGRPRHQWHHTLL